MLDLNYLRGIADAARQITIPIRTTAVTLRTRVWTGGIGLGTPTDTDVALAPYIKVREISTREIAGSGGQFELGDVLVGPITPTHSTGGYSEAQIAPEASTALTEILYVLSGAMNGHYRRIDVSTDRPFRYMLTLRRLNTTP